ncbi:adipocyte plasma membrane-associated protein-like [Bradysia coprophila]|uniref:adipocyte plasma membrane-associated protein-like n=1 Tax=Bradysia coprophila TaxID=38358 RepID=UPI00187D9BF9|nr:adipocyte plasma membrane-associated protein-like [Bradysia coprophila]XP_037042958.1 adipocyte plasma membrane-associated protein-like [Bradysia coprophila]
MQRITISVVVLAALVYYVTFAPPNKYLIDINPVAYSAKPVNIFDGPIKPNNILSKAEHLLVNDIHGPESLVYKNGHLYATTFGGMVVRIEGSRIVPIAKIGDGKCDVPSKLSECGRPLGLRFNSRETLYVVDAYHGLYSIDSIDTLDRKVTQLLPLSATRNLKGGESKFFDDITVEEGAGKNGGDVIYITDVGTKWDLSAFINIIIEQENSGRLLRFDTDTKQVTVVDAGFVFPNGVQITDDENSVLVCELGKQRILRIFINGPKSGKTEIFANLPGECDNIRRSANAKTETYWVALPTVKDSSNLTMFDRVMESPLIRRFLCRFFNLSEIIVETMGELFYSESLKSAGHLFKNGMLALLFHGSAVIAEYDAKGQILAAYFSTTDEIGYLSEVTEVLGDNGERILYLGSFLNNFLGKLVLK